MRVTFLDYLIQTCLCGWG